MLIYVRFISKNFHYKKKRNKERNPDLLNYQPSFYFLRLMKKSFWTDWVCGLLSFG